MTTLLLHHPIPDTYFCGRSGEGERRKKHKPLLFQFFTEAIPPAAAAIGKNVRTIALVEKTPTTTYF